MVMIWTTTLFCFLLDSVLCAARGGPLVIHNIHVLNPHAVHINGLGPSTASIEITSMTDNSRLSVRLQEAAGQLVINHAGHAFVGLFREAEDDVLSLHPEQTVLLADQDHLPSGTTVTDHAVPVGEDDILFLAVPHINPWPMPPIDLHGAIFNLGASCHITFGDWASRITLLLKDTRVSLVVATIGRLNEGAPVKPYKVMYSGEFDRFYAKMGHRRPEQNGSSSSSAPPPTVVVDGAAYDITREYDDEEEEYYGYDEEYDEYYDDEEDEEEEQEDEDEDEEEEEDDEDDDEEDEDELEVVPETPPLVQGENLAARSEENVEAPVVASNPSEVQQAQLQSSPTHRQLPPPPAQHHLQQPPPPSPYERFNLEFSNDGHLGELEKMIEELRDKPETHLDAIDPSMAFETPPRASMEMPLLISLESATLPVAESYPVFPPSLAYLPLPSLAPSSSSLQPRPLPSSASSSSTQHQPLPSLAPSSSSSSIQSSAMAFVPGVDRTWSMEEHQHQQEQAARAEDEVALPYPRRVRQSGRILLLKNPVRQQGADRVEEDGLVTVPLPASRLRVERQLPNEKAEKEEEEEDPNGKEEDREEPTKKQKRSSSTGRDAGEPALKRFHRGD